MTSDVASAVATVPRQRDQQGAFAFEPHHCFACGELNEQGLQLQIHTDPDGSWIETTIASGFQGWDSVAHGGIVCTILDEVMAWSVIGRGTWGVTARLNVAFRKPIPTGRAIRAEGRVLDMHRRASRTQGKVLDANPSYYLPMFIIAGVAYLIAWGVIHLLAPKLEPARLA